MDPKGRTQHVPVHCVRSPVPANKILFIQKYIGHKVEKINLIINLLCEGPREGDPATLKISLTKLDSLCRFHPAIAAAVLKHARTYHSRGESTLGTF